MISLSEYRRELFKIFKALSGTGAKLKVYHRRKVYVISITPSSEADTIKLRNTKKYKKNTVRHSDIDTDTCNLCGDLIVNDVCMRKGCKNANVAK